MRKPGCSNIINIPKNSFRYKLCIEDIKMCDEKKNVSFKSIEGKELTEQVYLFTTFPQIETSIGVFYRAKIKSLNDPYLVEIIHRLAWLNGYMNESGIKRMVEFINRYLTLADKEDVNKRVVSYEQMHPVVVYELSKVTLEDYNRLVKQNRVVLFSRKSRLNPQDKSNVTNTVRLNRQSILQGHIIHNAASAAIENTEKYLKITNPRVLARIKDDRIRTLNTLKRHIRVDTVAMLEHANINRVLKTQEVLDKFLRFLENSDGTTTAIAGRLCISRSTVIQFRRLKDKGDNVLNEPSEEYGT